MTNCSDLHEPKYGPISVDALSPSLLQQEVRQIDKVHNTFSKFDRKFTSCNRKMDEDQYVMNAESKHLINAVGSGDRQKAIDILHDIEHNSAKQKIFLEAVDVDLDVVKAFLRCGADICLRNQEGLDVLQYVLQTRELERDVKACVLQYMPGIWRAVNSDDVGTVRRLVNQWCHINIIKDFAHGVLAGDYRLVDHVLKSKLTLNVNLKNMGDQPMVDHLLKHGARLDTAVQGDSENYKAEMCEAVEVGDPETVREMLYTSSWSERGLNVCHADFRCEGDGQPLLHKAVLRQHHEVVEELAKYYVNTWRRKLDTVRDQHFRTALHYVYGMEREQQLIGILEDYGMSEYVMDKDGRSPLGFKDRRGLPEMKELLQYHLIQDFSNPEPDPWSVTLPLPITGFLKKCLHDNHLHRGHHHSNRGHSLDNKDQNISNSGYIDNNGYQVSRGVKFGDVSNFQSNKHGKSDGVSSLNYENGRNKADYLIQRYSQHLQCQPDGSEFTSLDALPLHNTPSISTRGMSRTGNKYARAEVHGRRKAEKLKLEKRHSGDFGVSKTRNVSDSTTDSEPCVSDHIHDANGISRSLSAEDAFNYHRYTEELGHATKELPKQDSTKSEVDTGGYDSDISSGFSEAGDESDDNQSEYETDREHEDTSQIQNCAIL
ncbi:hypothetical protein MAR_026821 [Mya arenaria]|uniref:Uncharacterized protein n=1 Tax=Mya arenaria TaxID=6604 RepID=A0ABY7EZT5_MYAAR|nr:hypothetical protein MAR_026821 [Mya arenaria]